MKPKCELCHKRDATGTIWLEAEESPIGVSGIYRACDPCGGRK